MKLTKRIENVKPSLTLSITAKANKLKAEGVKIVSFGAGEPDFNTPDYIIKGALDAINHGYTKYTPSSGILTLRKAICNKFLTDNGLRYEPNQIVVSNGAKHSLHNAIQAVVEDGDEVIIPAPYWLTYPELVTLAGGVTVTVECTQQDGYKLTPKALEAAITNKTKALILNSPSNPTGSVYTLDELKALAAVIEKHDLIVISDEIYEKLVYGKATHYSIAAVNEKMYNSTIVVNGVSKTYSMTGWRIGYLAAPLEIACAIDGMQSHTTSNACSISQYATLTALTGDGLFEREMIKVFDERRKLIYKGISGIGNLSCREPDGAFYLWVNVSGLFGKKYKNTLLTGAQDVAETMLDEGLAVVPGEAFGTKDYIRLSYAISNADIERGIENIKKYVSALI